MNKPSILLTLALLPPGTAALANDSFEEVVVTAEFRRTELMDAGASISVLGAEDIQQRAAQHLEEILNLAPNVNFAGGTSRSRYFQIRGVGDRSQFAEPLNPSVGLRVDGVDFSGIGSIGTLFDVEQVEVLRGPQGTLHGANALAGLIDIRSNAPTEDFYHRIDATAGDYDSFGVGLVSSGPLTDALRYRVAVEQFNSDGYTENDFLGDDDTQERDELTARGRLQWLLSEQHTIDLGVTYIDVDNGYDAFSLDNVRDTISDEPGRDTQESVALSLQTASSFSYFDLRTVFSYANSDSEYSYDEDWTFEGFHPFGYSSTDTYLRERDSISAELRLLSNESSRLFGGRSEWVVGLYYLGNDEDLDRRYTFAGPFDSEFDTETWAVFGQLDTALTERLTLVTGLRLENRDTDYSDSNNVDFNPDKDLWGGKLALEYDWFEGTLAYASVSRGYRANGVNGGILASINATDDPDIIAGLNTVRDFDEETLVNYEVGFKSSLLDNTLRARVALFYMDREDQQVRGSFLIPQQGGATTFVDYTSNAAEGENYGAEIELDWLASENLQLWANLGLLETEFENYVNVFGEDLSGRDQAQAPNYQFSVGGRFDFGRGFFLRLEVEGRDDFFFSDRHDAQADSYELVHGRLGYARDNWSLALWGRNLTDEDYRVRGFGSFGNDPRKDYLVEDYFQLGEPRMVGVDVSLSF
ncbi:MAG: TonB-dependent receptor [Halieaceae bacterium]|nr:TonB-dependent receptor [Halieaceae bacterium]